MDLSGDFSEEDGLSQRLNRFGERVNVLVGTVSGKINQLRIS